MLLLPRTFLLILQLYVPMTGLQCRAVRSEPHGTDRSVLSQVL